MSQLAERSRLEVLKARSDSAVARAERLGAHLERIWDAGGEPTAALVAEYLAAIKAAEVLLLERSLATPGGEEPES